MDVKSGAEQPDDAVGGECNDAEHQVAERLEVAANAEMAATEFIFDASIGAFCGGPLVVCQVPGIGDFDQPAPCALGGDKAAVGDTLQICEIIERTLVGGKRQEYGLLEPTR